jgi:hypothetical protein
MAAAKPLQFWSLLLACCLSLFMACSNSAPKDPKSAVIAMFGAMEKNDKAALAHLLDLAELMRGTNYEDYALQTDTHSVITNPEQILEEMTGDGRVKRRWFALQRIINKVDVMGETAGVEVTFVDKEHAKAYLTRFGLHVVNGKWKIYSFKTTQSSP